MVCQFVQISPKDLDTTICIDETMSLNSIDKFDKKRDFDRGRNSPSNSKQCRLYDMYFTRQQNIEATFTFEKKKSIYVTK